MACAGLRVATLLTAARVTAARVTAARLAVVAQPPHTVLPQPSGPDT